MDCTFGERISMNIGRDAVLNVKRGCDSFHGTNENDFRCDVFAVLAKGFYSTGGFVHLKDLDPTSHVTDAVSMMVS